MQTKVLFSHKMLKFKPQIRKTSYPISIQCRLFASTFQSDPKEVRIPVPWGHVAGKWWNCQNTQPVLAFHGWQDNAATFDRLIPLLSPTISVLAIDWPGHGQSSHFPKGVYYSVLQSVMTLRRIIDFYGWKSVTLMGHSLGGLTSFTFSALFNEQVDKLVLLDILTPIPRRKNAVTEGGKNIDKFLEHDALAIDTAPSYSFDELTQAVVKSQNGGLSEESAQVLLRRGTYRTQEGRYLLSRDIRLKSGMIGIWTETEILELCMNIKAHVLCLKADSSTYYFKKEIFHKFWETIEKSADQAILKVVPGKHHVHLEDPQCVAQFVNDFLLKSRN